MITRLGQGSESEKRNIVDYVMMARFALRIPQSDGPPCSLACVRCAAIGRDRRLGHPTRLKRLFAGLTCRLERCAWRIPKLTGILACDFSKLEFQWPSVALSGQMRTRTIKRRRLADIIGIRQAQVHGETGEADEVDETPRIGR